MKTIKCEWYKGTHKADTRECDENAKWLHDNDSQWKLCDYHKTNLLSHYTKSWRKEEEPEWIKIK